MFTFPARLRAFSPALLATITLVLIGSLSPAAAAPNPASPEMSSPTDPTLVARPSLLEPSFSLARNAGHHHGRHHKQHGKKPNRHGSAAIRALRVAAAQKGDPYRYGAAGPNAFDCSGLTSFSFRKAGVRLPRTSSAQRGATVRIPAKAAKPGDLVFVHSGGRVSHVGFYAGRHRILHSPYSGTRVRTERIWTSSVSYGRVR